MKSIIQNCRLQIDVKCACPVVKQRFEKKMLVAFIWSLTLLVLLLRGRRQMGGGGNCHLLRFKDCNSGVSLRVLVPLRILDAFWVW